MIRNLKVLVAAAMVLGAIGALSASGAQAAVEFHCAVEPCTGTLKPDEVAGTKTAHHVFIVENEATTESVSITCNTLDGEATANKKTVTELEAKNLKYTECSANGSPGVVVDMNGCNYNFTATGNVTITGCTNAAKQIEITIPECTFDIPEQALVGAVTYHNSGAAPNRELTVSTKAPPNHPRIKISQATGVCPIKTNQTLIGTYTTGNTLVTGETHPGGVMAETWWE